MKLNRTTTCVVIGLLSLQTQVFADDKKDTIKLPSIAVEGQQTEFSSEQTGEYKIENSATATRLNLDIKETPQSISVITRQLLDDFSLNTVNDAINATPAINVEKTETDRTRYLARGYDVTNFQVDGLGLPLFTSGFINTTGDLDTVFYDRIEVLRGANGLLSGVGNPAATVNYIRKRPTDEFQGYVKAHVGSWSDHRLEADISGRLNEKVRGRLVAAYVNKDSYLDRYEKDRNVLYGILDFDLTEDTVLTLAHSYQKDDSTANGWGALPLLNNSGNKINYSRSANTGQPWSSWENTTNTTFVELKTNFNNGWQTKAQLSYSDTESDGKLFYIAPSVLINLPVAFGGAGLNDNFVAILPAIWPVKNETTILDGYASGPFEFAGRTHELVVGAQFLKDDAHSDYSNGITGGLANLYGIATLDSVLNGNIPETTSFSNVTDRDYDTYMRTIYSSTKLNVSDDLNLVVGSSFVDFNYNSTDRNLTFATVTKSKSAASEWVPYIGAVYSLTDQLSAYASYSKIFLPQDKRDINGSILDPAEGDNIEAGLKMDFNDNRGLATFSIFKTEQDNFAVLKGRIAATGLDYYEAEDGVTSKGFELTVEGEVLDGLQLMGGYTYLKVEDSEGNTTARYSPEKNLKLSSVYQMPFDPKWKIGASIKWQSDIETSVPDPGTQLNPAFGDLGVYKQGAYSVVDLMTRYQLTPKLSGTLNVKNLFDKKYFTSFYGQFGQTIYAPPRSVMLTVDYKL